MWFKTLAGAVLLEQELAELERILPGIPGQMAIQLGGIQEISFLKNCAMSKLYFASQQISHQCVKTSIQCDYENLPFESNSVSLIILPHTLEFCTCPAQLLREIYRVLLPGGRLVILEFNRWSLWSWVYPGSGRFYSIWNVKKWLNESGYVEIFNKSFFFLGAAKKTFNARLLKFSDVLGQIFTPKMGAVYLIYAQKKMTGSTPIVSLWTNKTVPLGQSITPTTRVSG